MPLPSSPTLPAAGSRPAPSLLQRLLRTKPIDSFVEEPESQGLRRSMGLFQLTMLGVGATVGTGIFVVLTGAVPKAGRPCCCPSCWPASPPP
ncbi:hypothetical protein [Aquincola tertiaricarbonis]|uniref:hypothetical protein n=1 Tax=Aquincola tertiaricarbonis TaxID=391953 RepID=UPI0018DC407A|nr:hypothetical protein [Aquincola tertiaricarbonis]